MELGTKGLPSAAHDIKIKDLSGGQKARVAFAAISTLRPHVLLLDEPTNHLDIESVDALIDGINGFEGGVVLISHDRRLLQCTNCALWLCDRAKQNIRPLGADFGAYEKGVLKEIAARQAAEEERAAARAVARKKKRDETRRRADAASKRRGGLSK
jgi:ATP-binding cassette subfamily F protein 1